jgi:hypothetical protein
LKSCIRCGLCCELELCSKGRRKDKKVKGNCLYLIKHEDNTTSCKLVLDNKMPSCCINFQQGCLIQEKYPLMYEFQKEYRKEKLKCMMN